MFELAPLCSRILRTLRTGVQSHSVGPSIPMDYESSGGMTGGGRTTIISKDMISFKERSVVLVRISFISVGRAKVLN